MNRNNNYSLCKEIIMVDTFVFHKSVPILLQNE